MPVRKTKVANFCGIFRKKYLIYGNIPVVISIERNKERTQNVCTYFLPIHVGRNCVKRCCIWRHRWQIYLLSILSKTNWVFSRSWCNRSRENSPGLALPYIPTEILYEWKYSINSPCRMCRWVQWAEHRKCEPCPMSRVSNRTEGRNRPGKARHLVSTWYEMVEVSHSVRGSEEA